MNWVSFRQISAGVLLIVSLSGCHGGSIRRSDAPLQGSSIELEIPDSAPVINQGADRARYQSWKTCVDPLYPNGGLSVSSLQQKIRTPNDIRQLLENLRQAWEEDFLVQPSFLDDATLKKFFATSSLKWQAPENFYIHHDIIIQAQLESDLLPGLTVTIESRCWQVGDKSDSTAHLVGSVKISGGPIPGVTLRAVREVLGAETRDESSTAEVEFGIVHAPSGMGRITYTDPIKQESEGGFPLGIYFYVSYQQSQRNLSPDSNFANDEVVDLIDMREKIHRRL